MRIKLLWGCYRNSRRWCARPPSPMWPYPLRIHHVLGAIRFQSYVSPNTGFGIAAERKRHFTASEKFIHVITYIYVSIIIIICIVAFNCWLCVSTRHHDAYTVWNWIPSSQLVHRIVIVVVIIISVAAAVVAAAAAVTINICFTKHCTKKLVGFCKSDCARMLSWNKSILH